MQATSWQATCCGPGRTGRRPSTSEASRSRTVAAVDARIVDLGHDQEHAASPSDDENDDFVFVDEEVR